jgi:hypothetical protein
MKEDRKPERRSWSKSDQEKSEALEHPRDIVGHDCLPFPKQCKDEGCPM